MKLNEFIQDHGKTSKTEERIRIVQGEIEKFTKIIDKITEIKKDTRIWMVFFSKPLMMAKKSLSIFDMIKYAKDKGLTDVVVNSNANFMNESNARKLIESG